MKQVTVNLPDLPEGYDYTGEHRHPKYGELYLAGGRVLKQSLFGKGAPSFIVEEVDERWRASYGSVYYTVMQEDLSMFVVESEVDSRAPYDDDLHAAGNYFETREKANKAIAAMEKLLLNSHK